MNRRKMVISLVLLAFTSTVAMDAATARVRAVRDRSAAKAAVVTATPEETEARQDAHQENQE